MNPRRKSAITIAVFAAVLFLASAICAAGIISLFSGREVLAEPDTGPLIAPVMFVTATLVLVLLLVQQGVKTPGRRGSIALGSVLVGSASYLGYVLSGAVLYAIGSGRILLSVLFFGANIFGPFAIAVGLIALVVAFGYLLLLSYQDHGATGTPRWAWERADDDDGSTPKS